MKVWCGIFLVWILLLSEPSEGAIKAGLLSVAPAPLLDGNFNEATYDGLLKAQSDGIVSTVDTSVACVDEDCLKAEFARFAEAGTDLLFCMGFYLTNVVATMAPQYPQMKVASVDVAFTSYDNLTNVVGIIFREDELGFMAGCTMALLSNNSVAGAACGPPIPPILRFAHGLQNGFFHCCTDASRCRFYRDFLNSFGDNELGISEAEHLIFDHNASVVAGAAGSTGSASILRAAQLGVFAIGVDSDNFFTVFADEPPSISQYLLTSMLKKANVASYAIAKQVNEGTFTSGTAVFSLLLGGVDLAPCHLSCGYYPPGANETLQLLKSQLSVGSISSGVQGDGTFSSLASQLTNSWLLMTPANSRPPALLSHTSTAFSNTTMLLFGGRNLQATSNVLYQYDFQDDSWAIISPAQGSQGPPPARASHAAARYLDDGLLIYGGLDAGGQPLADFWLFNATTQQWVLLSQTGDLPGALQSHSLEVIGDQVLLFGGVTATFSVLNTLYRYDLPSARWTQINTANGPTGRQGQASVADPSTPNMYLFGGIKADFASTITDELWRFNLPSQQWTLLSPINTGPARSRASAIWSQERIFVYGGVDSQLHNEVWEYSFRFNTWTLANISSSSVAPSPSQSQSAARFYDAAQQRDFLLVFGGSEAGGISEDLWRFALQDAPPLVPREFFSCSERKTFFDTTERVQLDREAGIFPISYMCDDYIDCDNSYDEGTQCSPSLLGIWIGFAVIDGLLAVYCLVAVVVIWKHRTHPVIRASSPLFLTIVLSGCIIGLGAMTSFWGMPADASCNLQFWLSAIAFVLVFGSLFLKSYRVWKIFSSEYRAVYMKDTQLLLFLMGLLLLQAIVCSVWSGYGDPRPKLEYEPNTELQVPRPEHYFCYSDSSEVFFWVMIGMNSVLVIIGVVLVYKTRNISDVFSESSYVALAIYNFLIVGIFIIPILQLLDDNIASEILRNGAYFVWAAAPALLITIPKFWRLNESIDLSTELSKGTRTPSITSSGNAFKETSG